jgi:uncharacterized membrane protein
MYTIALAVVFPLLIQIPLVPVLLLPVMFLFQLYENFFPASVLHAVASGTKSDVFTITPTSNEAVIFYASFILTIGFIITFLKFLTLKYPTLSTKFVPLLLLTFIVLAGISVSIGLYKVRSQIYWNDVF